MRKSTEGEGGAWGQSGERGGAVQAVLSLLRAEKILLEERRIYGKTPNLLTFQKDGIDLVLLDRARLTLYTPGTSNPTRQHERSLLKLGELCLVSSHLLSSAVRVTYMCGGKAGVT